MNKIIICRETDERISFESIIISNNGRKTAISGSARMINIGLDPDMGVDGDGTAFPLDTFEFKGRECQFEIGIGMQPDHNDKLEISACVCNGSSEEVCLLLADKLFSGTKTGL